MGGEAVLPYHLIRELRALGHDPIALTHARVRDEITESIIWVPEKFHFIEDSIFEKTLYHGAQFIPQAARNVISYFGITAITHSRLARRARALAIEINADIIHQPTPVSPLFPSFLTNMPAPVIIGPLNGGMDFPHAFASEYSRGSNTLNRLGRALSGISNKLITGKKQAAKVLVANERTRNSLPSIVPHENTQLLVENGVDLAAWDGPAVARSDTPTFVYVGRLVWLKAVERLLEAFGNLTGPARLIIVGDGEDRAKLHALSKEFTTDRLIIDFVGFRRQSEIRNILAGSRALVLPSLRECGGAVILEAFATNTAAIATAWGGPLDYITAENGILVDPSTKHAFVAGLTQAMQELIDDPAKARRLGQTGRRDVEAHFNWAAKAKKMVEIYDTVLTAK